MATAKIRQATAASTSALAPDLPRQHVLPNGSECEISLVKALDLAPRSETAIWKLFDDNMRHLSATTSLAYTERNKRDELFDPSARYILIRSLSSSSASDSRDMTQGERGAVMPGTMPRTPSPSDIDARKGTGKGNGKGKGKGKEREAQVDLSEEELMGYCSFRFDTEETQSTRDAEVVYCYEMQLRSSARGTGLGKALMDIMEEVGRKREMDKVMLTCLKANTTALAFYRRNGYEPDEIDPTRMAQEEWADADDEDEDEDDEDGSEGEEEADYVILSKGLR